MTSSERAASQYDLAIPLAWIQWWHDRPHLAGWPVIHTVIGALRNVTVTEVIRHVCAPDGSSCLGCPPDPASGAPASWPCARVEEIAAFLASVPQPDLFLSPAGYDQHGPPAPEEIR